MIETRIKQVVRDVNDFPKAGIVFKDITPILKDAGLCKDIIAAIADQLSEIKVDAVAGIESRGFLFGMALANYMGVPFVPMRKAGKLPYKTIQCAYDLEYGSAMLEIHEDAFLPGQHVLIHDDLLATGGTVVAASKLIEKANAVVAGYSFIIALDFLNGREKLREFSPHNYAMASY